jgi:hypothetical protein
MENTSDIVDGYLAIILDEESQKLLLDAFPPLHGKVFAHHVTVAFKPTVAVYDEYEKSLGQKVALAVYGYAKDDKGQAVVVRSDILKDEKIYHITISTEGVSPVYSNTLLEKGFEAIAEPLVLHGTFEFIEHQRR